MAIELKDSENDRVGRTTVWRLKMHVSDSELRDNDASTTLTGKRRFQQTILNFRQKRMSVSPIHYPSYLSRLRSWHSDQIHSDSLRFFPCGCLREQNFVQERSINSLSEIVESRTRRLLPYPLIFSWCLQEKITYVYKMSSPSTRILVYIYTEIHQGSFYK